jgi:hypothetical protein
VETISSAARGLGLTPEPTLIQTVDIAVAQHRDLDTLDSYAPAWWTLASPDNHGVDVAAWTDTYE